MEALVRDPSTSGGTARGKDRKKGGTRAYVQKALSTPRAPHERMSVRREHDRLERATVRERAGSAVEPVSGASEGRAHVRNAGRACRGQNVACWRVGVALRVCWEVICRHATSKSSLSARATPLVPTLKLKVERSDLGCMPVERHTPSRKSLSFRLGWRTAARGNG